MHPLICLRAAQEYHGFSKGRADLKHRPILLCKVRKEGEDVAFAEVWIKQQLAEGDSRNFLGQSRTSKQRSGEVVGDRSSDRSADQIHLADELNALLCLVIKLKHEAKDIARVDEADNDDISRVWNLVVEDRIADSGFDELNRSAFWGVAEQSRLPGSTRQRPEFAVVVFQDLEGNQTVESQINDLTPREGRAVRSSIARSFGPVRQQFQDSGSTRGPVNARPGALARSPGDENRSTSGTVVGDSSSVSMLRDIERKLRENCMAATATLPCRHSSNPSLEPGGSSRSPR